MKVPEKIVIPGVDPNVGRQEAKRIMEIVGVYNLTVTPSVIDETTQSVTVNGSVPYDSNAITAPWIAGSLMIDSEVALLTERYGGVNGSGPLPLGQRTNAC